MGRSDHKDMYTRFSHGPSGVDKSSMIIKKKPPRKEHHDCQAAPGPWFEVMKCIKIIHSLEHM